MAKVAIAIEHLEVQLRRRADARLPEDRLQVNAALCGQRSSLGFRGGSRANRFADNRAPRNHSVAVRKRSASRAPIREPTVQLGPISLWARSERDLPCGCRPCRYHAGRPGPRPTKPRWWTLGA